MTSPPLLQNTALDILHSPLYPTFCFFPSQMSLSSVGQQCGLHTVLWPQFTTLSCTWQIRGIFSSSSYVRSVAYLFFSISSMTATLIHFKSRSKGMPKRVMGLPVWLTTAFLSSELCSLLSQGERAQTHPRDSEENRVGRRGRPREEERGKIGGKREQKHLGLSLIRMSWGLLEKRLCLLAAACQPELFLLKQLPREIIEDQSFSEMRVISIIKHTIHKNQFHKMDSLQKAKC